VSERLSEAQLVEIMARRLLDPPGFQGRSRRDQCRKMGEAMKVKILSGSQAGAVVEMPEAEAVQNLSSGFAEAVLVPEVPVAAISTTLGKVAVPVPVPTAGGHIVPDEFVAEASKRRRSAVKPTPKPAKGVVKRKRA
jgi:hypothetical protein